MDFKNGISINGVAVQPGYPQIAGLSQGKVLRSPDGVTVQFGVLQVSDLPNTVARKDLDNQFSVAQGVRGAASGQAAGLYLPWIANDTKPTVIVGSSNSSNNQVAVSGASYSSVGVLGSSNTGTAVVGLANGSGSIPLYAQRINNVTNSVETGLLMSLTTGLDPANGMGLGIKWQLTSSAFTLRDAAQISAVWQVPTDASRSSAIVFQAVANGGALTEVMRIWADGHITASGAFYPGAYGDCYFGRWGTNTPYISGNVVIGGGLYPSNQGSYYLYYGTAGGNPVLASNCGLFASGNLYVGGQSSRYFRDDGNYTRFQGNFVVDGDAYCNGVWLSTYIGYLNQSVKTDASPTFGGTLTVGGLNDTGSGTFGNVYTDYGASWTYNLLLNANDFSAIGFHDRDNRVDCIRVGGGIIELGYNTGWGNANVGTYGSLSCGMTLAQGTVNKFVTRGSASSSAYNSFLAQNSNISNLMYRRCDGYSWVNQNWAVGSDERMKAKVRRLDHGERRLHELRPVEHELPHTGSDRKQYGFVAQEVQAIYPELVEEGLGLNEGDDPMLSIRYGDIIPLLVLEIQALREEIAQLKQERK